MTDPDVGPQFGAPEPGVAYADRPAAFGILERDGRIACVFITRPEQSYFDLPGGAIEPGETAEAALVREFGEETGLAIRASGSLGHARQFMRKVDGEAVNNLCILFEAQELGEAPELKIEADHALDWLDPFEALTALRHDAHAWAVAAWLRRRP
ncbi:NUDIX domain-containing protein [soil metagenome]